LVIVGILAVVGISMLGNRQASAVRGLLDNLEGSLTNAHRAAVAMGRDIALDNWGNWTTANPLTLAYGDTALTPTQIQTVAMGLLKVPPVLPSNTVLPYSQTVAVPFFYQTADVIESRACVATAGSGAWGVAMRKASNGRTNQDITKVPPFTTSPSFIALVPGFASDGGNLINGTTQNLCNGELQRQVISGFSQRFNSTFVIEVVGCTSVGAVLPGTAMGLIVVQANSSTIYKFYNPGALNGDGQWRRI
jgi:type II secretory pathway pseudopilin PulG